MIRLLRKLMNRYPSCPSKTPFRKRTGKDERLTQRLGKAVQLVGDDIFVTIQRSSGRESGRRSRIPVLIKAEPDRLRSPQTLDCHRNGQEGRVYHSGLPQIGKQRIPPSRILPLAVTQMIKTGSLSRSDRVAKYNRLMRSGELSDSALYKGKNALYNLAE